MKTDPVTDHIQIILPDLMLNAVKNISLPLLNSLIENLQGLVTDWKPNSDNYRKSFVQDKPDESLKKNTNRIVPSHWF